tara:strand:+ start:318 stop:515 length:198 start_codon:yes stop_codon:yes gene_type:complete
METITLTGPLITWEIGIIILTELMVTIRIIIREMGTETTGTETMGTIETIIEEETCLVKRKNQTS